MDSLPADAGGLPALPKLPERQHGHFVTDDVRSEGLRTSSIPCSPPVIIGLSRAVKTMMQTEAISVCRTHYETWGGAIGSLLEDCPGGSSKPVRYAVGCWTSGRLNTGWRTCSRRRG